VEHGCGRVSRFAWDFRLTVPPRVSSTCAGLRYVAECRHLFIGLSVDQAELSRIHEEGQFARGTALPARLFHRAARSRREEAGRGACPPPSNAPVPNNDVGFRACLGVGTVEMARDVSPAPPLVTSRRASIELAHTPQCNRSATRPRSSDQLAQLVARVRPHDDYSERVASPGSTTTQRPRCRVKHAEILAHRQAPGRLSGGRAVDEPCWPATRQPLLSRWASPW
jgi:hypothetical protein